MKWSDVGAMVAKAAPSLGAALGGPAGGVAGALVANFFGSEESPEAVAQALSQDSARNSKLRELQAQNKFVLDRLAAETERENLSQVNETMRVTAKSDHGFVRNARPFLIYSLGVNLNVMIVGAMALLYTDSATPDAIGTVFGAISMPLSILAGAAGVYVRSRSTHDKALAAGQKPEMSPIGKLVAKFT